MSERNRSSNPWVQLWQTTVTGALKLCLIAGGTVVLFSGMALVNGGADIDVGEVSIRIPSDRAVETPEPRTSPERYVFTVNPPVSVAFSPDGRRLATGSDRGTVRLWDVGTGNDLTTNQLRIPYLGVWYSESRRSLRGPDGAIDVAGAVLRKIEPGTPAERAGLRAGDRILAVNGRPLLEHRGLRDAIHASAIGETVDLHIERRGRSFSLPARLAGIPLVTE